MAILNDYVDFDIQTLTDTVRHVFAQKNAFMGSTLVSSGAVKVSSNMPAGPGQIGETITMPYFGRLGSFVNNPDGSSVAFSDALAMSSDTATVGRSSMAFNMSAWAQGNAVDVDPYEEASRQIMAEAEREMDRIISVEAAATPLVLDVYSATSPKYLTPELVSRARAKLWGDEGSDQLAAMLLHSRSLLTLRTLKDGGGRPLLFEDFSAEDSVPRFMGLPIVESDRAPIVGTMGAVTSTGTGSEPTLTLAGTPLDLFELRIRKYSATTTLGATCTVQFSTNGGLDWSEPIAIPDTDPVDLIDPATDSLVGVNGRTGLTAAFSGNFSNQDNVYGSNATAKVTSLIFKKEACAFWYAGQNLALQTDHDIASDIDEAAMHLYYAPKRYRRVPYGTKCGVLAIKHNVESEAITTDHLDSLAFAP